MKKEEFEIDKILNDLSNNNLELYKLATTILSDYYHGLYHVLFLQRIGIKGDYLEKLFKNCCKSNKYLLFLTISMMECGTYSLTEIFDNLNLDNPISFVNDYTEECLEPKFFNKLNEHKEYCNNQYEIFKKKLQEEKTSKKL